MQLKSDQGLPGVRSPLVGQLGRVLSVDLNAGVAEVQFPDVRRKVALKIRQGKGGLPAVGEHWMLNQTYGDWSFAALFGSIRPTEWIQATLLTGWTANTNYGNRAPSFQLDGAGMTRLDGIASGTIYAINANPAPLGADILVLPEGYRPGALYGPVPVVSNNDFGEIVVLPNGLVRAWRGTAWVSLAGISFPAEQ